MLSLNIDFWTLALFLALPVVQSCWVGFVVPEQ